MPQASEKPSQLQHSGQTKGPFKVFTEGFAPSFEVPTSLVEDLEDPRRLQKRKLCLNYIFVDVIITDKLPERREEDRATREVRHAFSLPERIVGLQLWKMNITVPSSAQSFAALRNKMISCLF